MYKHPLVAYDDSPAAQRALTVGLDLAKTLGLELTTVTVQEDLPPYMLSSVPYAEFVSPPVLEEIQQSRDSYYADILQQARDRAAEAGVTLHAALVSGDEVEAVVDYARQNHHDLILVGFHPHSALSDRILGSTAHGITMGAPCCVLAVKG